MTLVKLLLRSNLILSGRMINFKGLTKLDDFLGKAKELKIRAIELA
jgi:hypothetical protein